MNGIRSFVPPTLRTLALLLMVLMVGVVMMSAQTKSSTPAKKKTTTATKQAAAQTSEPQADPGQRVFIDPVTKKMRQPDQSEIDALNAAGKQKKAGHKAAVAAKAPVSPTGSNLMAVDEDQMMYSVATKSSDGKVVTGCVDGKTKAEAVVKSSQPIATSGVNNEK
jgi:hypothetical protein